jgi:hypothetical protein
LGTANKLQSCYGAAPPDRQANRPSWHHRSTLLLCLLVCLLMLQWMGRGPHARRWRWWVGSKCRE